MSLFNFETLEAPQYLLNNAIYQKIELNKPALYWDKKNDIILQNPNIKVDDEFNTIQPMEEPALPACQIPSLSAILSMHEGYKSPPDNNSTSYNVDYIIVILVLLIIIILLILGFLHK